MAARSNKPEETGVPAGGVGEQPTDAVTEQVQEKVDVETEQGFRGVEVDPTPNEHYTVAGVLDGKPTPETDPEIATRSKL